MTSSVVRQNRGALPDEQLHRIRGSDGPLVLRHRESEEIRMPKKFRPEEEERLAKSTSQ